MCSPARSLRTVIVPRGEADHPGPARLVQGLLDPRLVGHSQRSRYCRPQPVDRETHCLAFRAASRHSTTVFAAAL